METPITDGPDGAGDVIAEFTREVISMCPDAIIGVDRNGLIWVFNEAAERITGWSREEALGQLNIDKIYSSVEVAKDVKRLLYREEQGGVGRLDGLETEGRTRDGRIYPVRLSAVLLFRDGEEFGSVGFFHDLTRRKELEEELKLLAITDALTGLSNRRHLISVLDDEVQRAERYDHPLTLVSFDLDNFKDFNDALGHQAGDDVLVLVSECARAALRGQDHAFRQGGDEFALVLVESTLEQGLVAAERFRAEFNSRWEGFAAGFTGIEKAVSLSLGLVEHRVGESLDTLMRRADQAMYLSKQAGGDCSTAPSSD